jgi:hypothetical protein
MSHWQRLAPAQWVVVGAYLLYLLPYVVVSYYDRYKFPVLVTEALLFVWGIERFLIGTSPSVGESVPISGARAQADGDHRVPEGIMT